MSLPGRIGRELFVNDDFIRSMKSKKRDKHGRVSYHDVEKRSIDEPYMKKESPNYPDDSDLIICLSHDIDDIDTNLKHFMASSILLPQYRNIGYLRDYLKDIPRKNTYDNFSRIIEMESDHSAKSTFFLLANSSDPIRRKYRFREIRDSVLNNILDAGFEVGLHTGYYSFDNERMIRKEKQLLERELATKIIGSRNHFLRFSVPSSWKKLARAGFEYDATFGYHDMIGFRNGVGYPFFPNLGKEQDILEIPLNIMDGTLFDYLKIQPREGWDRIKVILKNAKKYNAVVSVLWHNSTFSFPLRRDWEKVYLKIMKWGNENNALLTDCREVNKILRKI